MCEVEATMVLRQRAEMMNPTPQAEAQSLDQGEESRDLVLMSRKRQARIVSHLEWHKTQAHSA